MLGHNSDRNQRIFRSNPDSGYTKLSNAFLQDQRLSYEARGMMAELLSRPDDWEIRAESIVKSGLAGRDKVWRMLREAEQYGYAAKHQARGKGGKFDKQEYVITDDPAILIERAARELQSMLEPVTENAGADILPFPENPCAVQPLTEKPYTGQPCTANPQHTKERYIQNTEETKPREGAIGKVAAAVLTAAAMTPMAAAAHPIEHVMQAPAECWQTPKAQMAAATNAMEARAQKQIWITPLGTLEVGPEFRRELQAAFPLVEIQSGLAIAAPNVKTDTGAVNALQQVRRQFGYRQQDLAAKQARAAVYGKKPGADPTEKPADMPQVVWDKIQRDIAAKRAQC